MERSYIVATVRNICCKSYLHFKKFLYVITYSDAGRDGVRDQGRELVKTNTTVLGGKANKIHINTSKSKYHPSTCKMTSNPPAALSGYTVPALLHALADN